MLKKIFIALIAIVSVGCTGLDTIKNLGRGNEGGPIREIGGSDQTEITQIGNKVDDGRIESKEANNQNINEYLFIVKSNLRGSVKKVDDTVKNNYTVALGETLIFPLDNERAIKLTSSPKNTNSNISLSSGKVNFRSVYKGQYILSTYIEGSVNRKINVSVISKYDFSERDVYDIIVQNSENKSKDLENAVTLYKMLFPAGRYSKEVNYLFLNYAYETKNTSLMNEALSTLKNDFSSYSDSEKAKVLRVAKMTNKNIFVPSETYKTNNSDLKSALQEYVGNKENLDKVDKVFIEKTRGESPKSANETMKERMKSALDGSYSTKTENSSNKRTESKGESFYDKAMKNLNSNPRVAIENFKKSLSTEKIQDKKPEIYYNIASSYAKLGNKVEVTKYLRLLKQEFPNSEWVKKSEALTKALK